MGVAEARQRADEYPWSEEAWDYIVRLGHESSRLYPYTDSDGKNPGRARVWTPKGWGRLVQVLGDEARVVLEAEQRRADRTKALPSKQQRPGEGNQAKMEFFDYREISPE